MRIEVSGGSGGLFNRTITIVDDRVYGRDMVLHFTISGAVLLNNPTVQLLDTSGRQTSIMV